MVRRTPMISAVYAEQDPQIANPAETAGSLSPQAAPDGTPRRRRRRAALVIGVVAAVLLAAGVVTYLVRDDRRFDAVPPACETIQPFTGLLGVNYTLRQKGERNFACDLWLPRDHPAYRAAPKITFGFLLADDASDAADKLRLKPAPDVRALPGIGDEAYLQDRNVYFRVGNLAVAIFVFPNEVSNEDQVKAFATAVANHLKTL
ncbi:hypothetical protein KRM28CT15_37020 [Krasilnikovia sp. M28-CT-15]